MNKTKIVGTKRYEIKAVCTIKNDGQFVRVSSYNTNLMNVMAKLKLGKIHNISGNFNVLIKNNFITYFFFCFFSFYRCCKNK